MLKYDKEAKICSLTVVYFDQKTGALHVVAGRNHLFWCLNKFSQLFPSEMEKGRKSNKNKEKYMNKRGLPAFRCHS